jgi:hypothetical protein
LSSFGEGEVGEPPIVAAVREPGPVDRRPVAQGADAEIAHEVKILLPALVVAAFLHLVDADGAILDLRIAVLDSGREYEGRDHRLAFAGGRQQLSC